MKCVRLGMLALAGLSGTLAVSAQNHSSRSIKIAAAADLQPVMPAIAQAYEREKGVKLEVTFGSSSVLAAQIVNGAPFDVFLAADYSFPEKVVAADLAEGKQPIPYAKGTLVLWARNDFAAPLSMDTLNDPRITKIAIADEFHAPYGRAAYAALRWLKLEDAVKGKLVVGENVSQTAQFVDSGNAQVGFISLSIASSAKFKADGHFVRVPAVYPEIRQCGVVMKKSPNLADAHAFMEWIQSSEVQSHLSEFGLQAVR